MRPKSALAAIGSFREKKLQRVSLRITGFGLWFHSILSWTGGCPHTSFAHELNIASSCDAFVIHCCDSCHGSSSLRHDDLFSAFNGIKVLTEMGLQDAY